MTDSPLKYPARVNVLMLATCRGAKAGANSMTTRPPGSSTYRVFSGSSGRQSAGLDAAKTSGMLKGLAASAECDKKTSAQGIKNLRLRFMHEVLHKSITGRPRTGLLRHAPGGDMGRISFCCLVLFVAALLSAPADAQFPGSRDPGGGLETKQNNELPMAPDVV